MQSSEQYATILRRHGLKRTAQRLAIVRALAEHGRHLTAEEVHALVRPALPAISLTTVYKVLHELDDLGQVRRVDLGDGTARFDPNTAPHAHLVCRRCRRIEDLPATDYHVGLPPVAARGYDILDHAVVFYGTCPACRAAAAVAAPAGDVGRLSPGVRADK